MSLRARIDHDPALLTPLQVKSLKKKLEEVTKDNEDLLCAVKYLKSKMEQKDASSRCATPTVEASRSTSSFGREVHPASLLASADHETRALRDKCATLEREVARLRQRALSEGFTHFAAVMLLVERIKHSSCVTVDV